jgi:hypothetical protein
MLITIDLGTWVSEVDIVCDADTGFPGYENILAHAELGISTNLVKTRPWRAEMAEI